MGKSSRHKKNTPPKLQTNRAPTEVILKDEPPKNTFDKYSKKAGKIFVKYIAPLISLLVASSAFVLSLNPSLNRWNMNYEQRALAGDIEAQMFLADYNYQTGNIEDCMRYYSMVMKRPKLRAKEKYCFYIASNNLSYIYVMEVGGKEAYNTARQYLDKGIEQLVKGKNRDDLIEYRFLVQSYLRFWLWIDSFFSVPDGVAYTNIYDIDEIADSILKRHPFLMLPHSTIADEPWMDEAWMDRAEFDEETKAFYREIKELYESNRLFKLLYDHGVINRKSNYVMSLWGFYYADTIYGESEDDEIIGALTLSEYEQLPSTDEEASWESDVFGNVYWAKGDEDPLAMENDKLIRNSAYEMPTYSIFRELPASNIWNYISYINYFEESYEVGPTPGRSVYTKDINDIDWNEALESVDLEAAINEMMGAYNSTGLNGLFDYYQNSVDAYSKSVDDYYKSMEEVEYAWYKMLPTFEPLS